MIVSHVSHCVSAIIAMAEENGIQLKRGIELFAGDGSIYTLSLAKHLDTMRCFDIDEEKCRRIVQKNKAISAVCTDSVAYLQHSGLDSYDLISLDNPLCIFGNYCEHFDIFPYVHKLVPSSGQAILAFDIVHTPYNRHLEENKLWLQRRKDYYQIDDASLELDFAQRFYRDKLTAQGLCVTEMKCVCREVRDDNDYFYMIICVVERKGCHY